MKRLTITILICLFSIATSASADSVKPNNVGGSSVKKQTPPSAGKKKSAKKVKPPTKAQKAKAFEQEYYDMKVKGGKEFNEWKSSITDGSDDERAEMLVNVASGKSADGKKKLNKKQQAQKEKEAIDRHKAKGFKGDPNDPGPSDWSDYIIETDGKGNVTGIKKKDHYDADADGDGKVTEQEALDYEKKQADEHMDKDGDGKVSKDEFNDAVKDMDKDGDGKVSKDELERWNDKKKKEKEEKERGPPVDPKKPDWDKDGDGVPNPGFTLSCWVCQPDDRIVLHECAYGLVGTCSPDPCPSDKQPCSSHVEVKRDGTKLDCFMCGKSIVIEYIIIWIETPYGRYVLKKNKGKKDEDGFEAKQVMGLQRVETSDQGMAQLAGMMGGMGGGSKFFGGMLGSVISPQQIVSQLASGLGKKGKYSDNCFNKGFEATPLAQSPPQKASGQSVDPGAGSAAPSQYGRDFEKEMIQSGPSIACGMQGKEKALSFFDAAGRKVTTVLQSQLKNNPNALMDAMNKTQSINQTIMGIRQGGFASIQQMGTGMIKSKLFGMVQQKAQSMLTQSKGRDADKPNDPYYKGPKKKKKKKKKLGILGSSKGTPKIIIGSSSKAGRAPAVRGTRDMKEMKYQWGLHKIGFKPYSNPNSAWHLVDEQSRNALVAVIDSGLDMNHYDVPKNIWVNQAEIPGNGIDDDSNGYVDDINGWNFLNENNDLTDKHGHGTFVSGIIAANTDNGKGIAGINPGAVIMPLKVVDSEGQTNSFLMTRAIYYAVDNGARVISMSLGSRSISKMERAAMNYAKAMNVFVAVASGNVNEYIGDHAPSSAQGAFSVGSIDSDGQRSTISNWGPNNALLGPGDSIISLIATSAGEKFRPQEMKRGVRNLSGTSFSTPMVAAVASLLLANNPELTAENVEDILLRTSRDMDKPGWDGHTGAGLIDAHAALSEDVGDRLTIMINETRINKNDKKKFTSVDVFATVRGDFESFVVELGKGENARKFKQVAGPFTEEASFDWITRMTKKAHVKGSKDWVVRLVVTDKQGQKHIAQTLLIIK